MKIPEVLTVVLLVGATSLSLLVSYNLINVESTVTLLIFNIFFVSLIFQLKASLIKKSTVLLVGNILGLSCNMLFFKLSYAGQNQFPGTFGAIYVLIFPFLNLIWMVPFWSFSLSFLAKTNDAPGNDV